MKMRSATALLAVVFLVLASPSALLAAPAPLMPGDIIGRETIEDGDTVVIQGEAIGESLRAESGNVWVNVLGGGDAIGVHMTSGMAEQIGHYGEYSTFGDTVEVRGVVNYACAQHGGEFDIHADQLVIIEPGGQREQVVELWKLLVGAPLILLGLGLSRLFVYLRNRGPA